MKDFKIEFVTSHGRYELNCDNFKLTLNELCLVNKLPIQSMNFYGVSEEKTWIILGIHEPIENFLGECDSIAILPNRNIDYPTLCRKDISFKRAVGGVAEYSFPSEDGKEINHFEFSQKECQDYVAKEVVKFLENEVTVDPRRKIVIGVSGGGDSNTLIKSFIKSQLVKKDQLIAVMMLGIPDWDLGKDRASALCQEHNVPLRFVEANQVNRLLGRKSSADWVEDFEKVFPDADLEVLGTLAIRLALRHIAEEVDAQSIVTGLNLEDILGECLLATVQGKLPPPFPVRIIDNLPLWLPLYRIPKKILDGCYPDFSLANYNDRYPSHMLGRAIPYYFSQMLSSNLPGIEFDLIDGYKKLISNQKHFGQFDDVLGFSTVEVLPEELKNQWLMFTQM